MIIRVADLEPEGLHVEAPLVIEPLRTDEHAAIRIEGAVLRGDVRRTGRGVEFRGRLACRAEVLCARCLEPVHLAVDRSFNLHYAFAAPRGKDIEIPEGDLDVDFLKPDGELDLTDVAREQIYLELPMKPVCSDHCRGLCPHCGENLNRGGCRCDAPLPNA